MKLFSQLYLSLDSTKSTLEKIGHLENFFSTAEDTDKVWAIALFSGRKPKRPINVKLLHQWAAEAAGFPLWLFEECYHTVGDLAETIALILPENEQKNDSKSLTQWMSWLKDLAALSEAEKKQSIVEAWRELSFAERFIFNKLITGGFRVGVSQSLVVKALSKQGNLPENHIADRLMGEWKPEGLSFRDLLGESLQNDLSRPYPFFLAYPLEKIEDLGEIDLWQAERKWDGIRGQLINRDKLYLWTRGEELVTDRFPEFKDLSKILPTGVVLDGEILPYSQGKPLPFALLQTRITKLKPSKENLKNVPVVFVAYDILEFEGEDIRQKTLFERRKTLEEVVSHCRSDVLVLSEIVEAKSWDLLERERENSRLHSSEGLMLKKLDSSYKIGRKRGDWWKWKVDPMSIDAVMVYAQAGHGRRANLYSDYTFALWNSENKLVTFTKAYSGLNDQEMKLVDDFVKKNTVEKFGPIRVVKPELVFEIGFEGINRSNRHKSGVALRFPRILRTRFDKKPEQANRLEDLLAFL